MTEIDELKDLAAEASEPCESAIVIVRQQALDNKEAQLKIPVEVVVRGTLDLELKTLEDYKGMTSRTPPLS